MDNISKYAREAAHRMYCDNLIHFNQVEFFAGYVQWAIDKEKADKFIYLTNKINTHLSDNPMDN